ncbi:unnamed protein product, partial [Brassica napus]
MSRLAKRGESERSSISDQFRESSSHILQSRDLFGTISISSVSVSLSFLGLVSRLSIGLLVIGSPDVMVMIWNKIASIGFYFGCVIALSRVNSQWFTYMSHNRYGLPRFFFTGSYWRLWCLQYLWRSLILVSLNQVKIKVGCGETKRGRWYKSNCRLFTVSWDNGLSWNYGTRRCGVALNMYAGNVYLSFVTRKSHIDKSTCKGEYEVVVKLYWTSYIWIMVIMKKMVLRDYSRIIGNQIYKFDLGSSQGGLWNVRLNIVDSCVFICLYLNCM